jgi:hypothetical protein
MADKWGIYKSGTFYPFPAPLETFTIEDSYDIDRKKAILVEGEQLAGQSRNAVRVQVSGKSQISASTDLAVCTERTQLELYTAFRSNMHVTGTDKFELFMIYSDTAPAYYRKFKNCCPDSARVTFGDDSRLEYPYSLSFMCEDPVIYSSSPGS